MLAGSFFDGDKGYSFFNKRVILRMAQGENMSWNGSVMSLSLDIMTTKDTYHNKPKQ